MNAPFKQRKGKAAYNPAEVLSFQLRLPPQLRDQLKEAADYNFRSVNSEIVWRLRESFKKEQQ